MEVNSLSKKLECPYGIPENECCKEKDCPVWNERQKKKKKSDK